VSKRISNPKDMKFIVVKQHMMILSLKRSVVAKEREIEKLKETVKKLKKGTLIGRIWSKIKNLLRGNND